MNNIFLFIHGKAQSGKDTLYHSLKWLLNGRDEIPRTKEEFEKIRETDSVIKMAFADEVKRELTRIRPEISFEKLMTDNEYKEKYRKDLVEIGDGYRQEDEYIWINKLKKSLIEFDKKEQNKIVCTTDLRYLNEFKFAKRLSHYLTEGSIAFTATVNASLPVRLARMSRTGIINYLKYASNNESETGLDHVDDKSYDFVVNNDLNLESMEYILGCYQHQTTDLIKIHTILNPFKQEVAHEHRSIQTGLSPN